MQLVRSLTAFVLLASAMPSLRADELRIAVAANFATAMETLSRTFEDSTGHRLFVSAGSTGAHYAQIVSGAPFDLFFAADVRRPMLLEDAGTAVGGSRFTYAIGRVVLWSPDVDLVDAEGAVLASDEFRYLAIANPDLAPYGAAARQVLERMNVWERVSGRLVLGQDIGQTYAFVHSRAAELGFVAWSQIRRPDLDVEGSWWLVPQTLHEPIEQQAVVLSEEPAAQAFVDFVRSDAGAAIIRSFGYEP